MQDASSDGGHSRSGQYTFGYGTTQIATRVRAVFMIWSPRRQYITAMTTSPSQDPQARAQAQAEWRTLKTVRTGGALVVMAAMVVFGIVGLAVGQEGSGFTALFIGGIGMVLTVVARTLRRRRGGN